MNNRHINKLTEHNKCASPKFLWATTRSVPNRRSKKNSECVDEIIDFKIVDRPLIVNEQFEKVDLSNKLRREGVVK